MVYFNPGLLETVPYIYTLYFVVLTEEANIYLGFTISDSR